MKKQKMCLATKKDRKKDRQTERKKERKKVKNEWKSNEWMKTRLNKPGYIQNCEIWVA